MKKLLLLKKHIYLIFGGYLLITMGCEDPAHLERYKDPDWLGGSSIETMEEWTKKSNGIKDSSYTQFMKLMDLAEYRDPVEKGLFTLFVPSDRAFEEFMEKRNLDSLGQLNKDEAQQLFTLHFLRNPLSRYYLVYTYKFDEVQDEKGEYGPLFFRQPTRSSAEEYYDTVKYFEEFKGEVLRIYGTEKFIPLFSTELMNAIGGAKDGSDYEFICRTTKWSKSGLNWHNAEITKAEIPTSSGFIYKLDRVIEPPPNIDMHLAKNKDKYGLFYDIMQRFATYTGRTLDKDKGYYKYRKSYNNIYNMADENGPFPGHLQEKDIFTALVPTNDILQAYLDKNFLSTYESIDSMPQATLIYIIQSHLAQSMLLASKMGRTFFNTYGDEISIDTKNDISDAFLCSNGVVYALNKVLEPLAFKLAPGPLFYDGRYSTFLNVLMASGYIPSLSRKDVRVTVFAPDNNSMSEYGIRYEKESNEIQMLRSNGQWHEMSAVELELLVNDHIILGKEPDISKSGFMKMGSGNYVKYDNSILWAGGNIDDNDDTEITTIIDSEINGVLYLMDNVLKTPENTMAEFIMNDPELSVFDALLDSAQMITYSIDPITGDTTYSLNLSGISETWTGFIPTNSALAADPLPADASDSLIIDFVNYHFINNVMIFDDGVLSGEFETVKLLPIVPDEDIQYGKLNITNEVNQLTITDNSNQQVVVPHNTANNLVKLGVAHKINTTLKW